MKIQLSSLAGVVLLVLSACGTTSGSLQEPGPTFLTHDELKALLSRTRTVRIAGEVKGTLVLAQDGTAQAEWSSGGAKGTWRIDGAKYCSIYPGIRRETCYNLQKTGENTYTLFRLDGSPSGTWEMQK